MKLKRSNLNIIIDVLMFVVMMPIVGIGFLIKYVLLSGVDRNAVYGNDVDLFFWGMDRHQWGDIHLWLGAVLIFLFVLHLIFHWKMMLAMFASCVNSKVICVVAAIALPLIVVLFAIAPLFLQPEVRLGIGRHAHAPLQQRQEYLVTPEKEELISPAKEDHHHVNVDINGRMTITEVASTYDVSIKALCTAINVSSDKADLSLGRLKKQHDFTMEEIRIFIENNSNKVYE